MRLGLGARILIAGGIVVLFLVVEFVLVLRQFQHVRTLTRSEQRAEQSVVAASRVEKLVLDLETGTRGYLITRDRRFLAPSRVAKTSLPAETRAFQALAPGPVSDEVAVRARDYIRDWALPVAAIARVSGDAAVVEAATRRGQAPGRRAPRRDRPVHPQREPACDERPRAHRPPSSAPGSSTPPPGS